MQPLTENLNSCEHDGPTQLGALQFVITDYVILYECLLCCLCGMQVDFVEAQHRHKRNINRIFRWKDENETDRGGI